MNDMRRRQSMPLILIVAHHTAQDRIGNSLMRKTLIHFAPWLSESRKALAGNQRNHILPCLEPNVRLTPLKRTDLQ